MPKRTDIQKILVIGSGPIVIGQAAEFDYSGAQACKVLLEEGYEVVLVNSNPATIMTDPEFATATYIEPLLPASVAKVIERERPDALLPTLGGGTALNLARDLSDDGTLEKFGVELIGADYDAILRAEDRDLFKETMEKAGLRSARSAAVSSISFAYSPGWAAAQVASRRVSLIGIRWRARASPFRCSISWNGNDAPPAPPGEVQASTSRFTRSGCRSTSSWATMPPKETPMTRAASHPWSAISAAASSA